MSSTDDYTANLGHIFFLLLPVHNKVELVNIELQRASVIDTYKIKKNRSTRSLYVFLYYYY